MKRKQLSKNQIMIQIEKNTFAYIKIFQRCKGFRAEKCFVKLIYENYSDLYIYTAKYVTTYYVVTYFTSVYS